MKQAKEKQTTWYPIVGEMVRIKNSSLRTDFFPWRGRKDWPAFCGVYVVERIEKTWSYSYGSGNTSETKNPNDVCHVKAANYSRQAEGNMMDHLTSAFYIRDLEPYAPPKTVGPGEPLDMEQFVRSLDMENFWLLAQAAYHRAAKDGLI